MPRLSKGEMTNILMRTPAVKAEQGAQQVKAQDAAVNQIKEQGLS